MRIPRRWRRRLLLSSVVALLLAGLLEARGLHLPAVVIGLTAVLLAAALLRRARPRRRSAASHVNVDGSAKRAYRSEGLARVAAREYERDFGERMNAYRCTKGRHWHIGHVR